MAEGLAKMRKLYEGMRASAERLKNACATGNVDVINDFLEKEQLHTLVNRGDFFQIAARHGQIKLVQLLLNFTKAKKLHLSLDTLADVLNAATCQENLEVLKCILNFEDLNVGEISTSGTLSYSLFFSDISIYLMSLGYKFVILPEPNFDPRVLVDFQENRIMTKEVVKFLSPQYQQKIALIWFCLVKRGWRRQFKYFMHNISKLILIN